MPQTKKFSLRIEILDELLASKRRYTPSELLEVLNEKLLERGEKTIGKRTFADDIKYLRDELNMPLNRPSSANNYYNYLEPASIKKLPLSTEEVVYLREAAQLLQRATPFEFIQEIDGIVRKLENKVYTNDGEQQLEVDFDNSVVAAGTKWLNNLLAAVKDKSCVRISYQSFKATEPTEYVFHPYLLKSYKNRWFLLGKIDGNTTLTVFALDRITGIKNSSTRFLADDSFNANTYFNHLVGVSVPQNATVEDIQIKVHANLAPYIKTKPLHSQQKLVTTEADGSIIIALQLYVNVELVSVLLGYAADITVIQPQSLRQILVQKLEQALQNHVS
ncbi:MAG: WYL domain-containing protein [Bacteroidetes bacterium]|nr:MAG: WYL domain-containing protein [Bacteroidota bacterium]TAE62027.1 MAG: WYL domain-containing protein [Bacteroidota bacterium]